jgi:hypothetical protein
VTSNKQPTALGVNMGKPPIRTIRIHSGYLVVICGAGPRPAASTLVSTLVKMCPQRRGNIKEKRPLLSG